jgi:hypothetical protein
MASSTGAISGTPTVVHAAAAYTVTVTDFNGATATANFSLTVSSAVTANQVIASKVLTVNQLATAFMPVTGSGGTSPLAYSVAPSLPTGLNMASSTGAITGTPTVAQTATIYTVTVTDANSATASATFSLIVENSVTATVAVPSASETVFQSATAYTPVTGSGGTAPLSYSVSPSLPAGLTMAPTTGSITGTPAVAQTATTYAVTITDANSATATANFSLTVNKQASMVTVIASPGTVTPQQTTTLTATVAATGAGIPAVPGGTVTFSNNGTALATVSVSNGVAQLVTQLPAGTTAIITATYSGDANFLGSTSSANATVVVAALDFSLNFPGGQSQTVTGGGTATYTLTVSPTYGVYPGEVTFSASGLPPASAADFTPATIAANGGQQTVTLQVHTSQMAAAEQKDNPFERGGTGLVLGFLLLPLLGARRMRNSRLGRGMLLLLVVLAGSAGLVSLSGCGSNNGHSVQSTITVTATSGTVQHTQTVALTVK